MYLIGFTILTPVFLNWSIWLKNTKYNYSVICIVDHVKCGMTWHVTTQDIRLRKCLERKWTMSVIDISYF
jgi:hypothetical protein